MQHQTQGTTQGTTRSITRRITRWIGRSACAALTFAAFAACADAPTAPHAASAAAAQAHRMIAADCVTADGCCDNTTAIVDCSGGGGGGGGGGPTGPNVDVKLNWFSDHGTISTDDYYELRHRTRDAVGNEIYYNAQFLHGSAFMRGEFTTIDLGRAFPCGGRIDVELYKLNIGWFGHVTSSEFRGTLSVYDGQQDATLTFNELAAPVGFPPPPPGTQPSWPAATARYTWPAGTCQ